MYKYVFELIEIECGKNGKPLYIPGIDDNEQKINSIIKQLEKTAGVGNFKYLTADEFDGLYQDDEEDEEIEDDEYKDWTFEEKRKLFLNSYIRLDRLKEEDVAQLLKVSESIIIDEVDIKLYDQYYSDYSADLDVEIIMDEIFDEVLGVEPGTITISNEVQEIFETIYFEGEENQRLGKKLLEKFKEQKST